MVCMGTHGIRLFHQMVAVLLKRMWLATLAGPALCYMLWRRACRSQSGRLTVPCLVLCIPLDFSKTKFAPGGDQREGDDQRKEQVEGRGIGFEPGSLDGIDPYV